MSKDITIVIPRRGINDEGKGKKHALHRLISEATGTYVWLRDDDIVPPAMSCEQMEVCLHELGDPDLLVLPLRMLDGSGSLLCRLQQAEYAALQQLTMEQVEKGSAILCSGANMVVKRDRWLESYEDLHPEIASGDDMFLLDSFKHRGLKIIGMDDATVTAAIAPMETLGALLRQRMRWAGKAPRLRDKEIRRYGLLVVLGNVLQVVCPLILLVKFPLEYQLIKKRDASVSPFLALLLEVIYPWYMLLCLIGGIVSLRTPRPQF